MRETIPILRVGQLAMVMDVPSVAPEHRGEVGIVLNGPADRTRLRMWDGEERTFSSAVLMAVAEMVPLWLHNWHEDQKELAALRSRDDDAEERGARSIMEMLLNEGVLLDYGSNVGRESPTNAIPRWLAARAGKE